VSLVDETLAAIKAANHLTDQDKGAVEAMLALARKVDAWDVIVGWALDDARANESRPTVPQNDNVSLSAYLKYAESLGLTPAGRAKLAEKKPEGGSGKLNGLRSVPKPA
jgi:phage terminase small subunit